MDNETFGVTVIYMYCELRDETFSRTIFLYSSGLFLAGEMQAPASRSEYGHYFNHCNTRALAYGTFSVDGGVVLVFFFL